MKIRKSRGYINYGPIPKNEYANATEERSTVVATVLEDGSTHKQRMMKRQKPYPVSRGWARSWKVNGWRAEAASLQDEIAE